MLWRTGHTSERVTLDDVQAHCVKAFLSVSTDMGVCKENLRRTACSMAKTQGGYSVLGVVDRGKSKYSNPIDRIVGINKGPDYAKEPGEKCTGILRYLGILG
jgi:hypothetical protein